MKDRPAAIIGLGISGAAAADLLLREGCIVSVFDDRDGPEQRESALRLTARGVGVFLGEKSVRGWKGFEMVIVSPGIPSGHPLLLRAHREGAEVLSEVALASRFLKGRLIAVTGTNGKTTTVSLLTEIFRRAGRTAIAGGNIGYPLSRIALEERTYQVVVAEISSFQLENLGTFRPAAAVILNLTPDHLDRYPSVREYGETKLKIFARQGRGDRAVFPEEMASWIEKKIPSGVEKVTWGGSEGAARFEEGEIRVYSPEGMEVICSGEELPRRDPAFLSNALAAVATARAEGVSGEDIGAVLKAFPGLPHRLEYLGEVSGVAFYNDSKSTNPDSVVAALQAFSRPVIWLAGGSEKGLDFSPITRILPGPIKRAVLLGECREKLGRVVAGKVPFQFAADLEEAVAEAFRQAVPGEAILLSPGCASYDMFENYQARGDLFKRLMRELSPRVDREDNLTRDTVESIISA